MVILMCELRKLLLISIRTHVNIVLFVLFQVVICRCSHWEMPLQISLVGR